MPIRFHVVVLFHLVGLDLPDPLQSGTEEGEGWSTDWFMWTERN
jgi:hypothetical protein